ncbi:MAG: zinc ribbon domain-containing protein [Pseudonocardiaceae bacterium]
MAELRRQLDYKTREAGACLVVADRWFPSSKTCSACGAVRAKSTSPPREGGSINRYDTFRGTAVSREARLRTTYPEFPLSSGHALDQGRPYADRYANR